MCGILTVRNFGRRTLLLYGHAFMGIEHFAIAYCAYKEYNYVLVGLINVFIFTYLTTQGPVAWIYSAETVTDATLGMVIMTLWIGVTFETLTIKSLEAAIAQPGVFSMFGCLMIVALVYTVFFIGETKGLSEAEKKEIYLPGAKYGRDLKAGEFAAGVGNEHKSRKTLKRESVMILNYGSQSLVGSTVKGGHSSVNRHNDDY